VNDSISRMKALLGSDSEQPWWRRPALWISVLALAAAAGGYFFWQGQRTAAAQPRYATETVNRGNLVVAVSANGTVVPTNKVDIGSELSGTVARVLVDVNDRVKKGQVLAELDTEKLRDQVMRSRASLDVAQARQRQAEATVREATGNLQRLQEVSRLSAGRVPSQAEMATAQATLARAQADVSSTQAGIADAKAAASVDETNLRKASIRSPINGVVLSRSVDPGNAVAASLQAVTLFTIAEDLAQMKLQVNVDEADVGQVSAGQKATFNVSAYPSRNYPAAVTRVYYGSTITNNVVTYVAELTVDNKDLTLRPGMTATARVIATERNDVLLVPNAALRFRPSFADASAAPVDAGSASGGIVSKLVPRLPSRGTRRAGTQLSASREVWALQDGKPVSMSVVPGATDGRMTEVRSDKLQPGMQVVTEQASGSAK
jgi:HlyD family secretion protein